MMAIQCGNCGAQITEEKQRVGRQISSDKDKPDGGIYKSDCHSCGEKQTEKVQRVLNGGE